MSKYIKLEDAIDALYSGFVTKTYIENKLKELPTIDIVRCSECKKAFDAEGEIICNHLSGMVGLNVVVKADDFCSYGERIDK